MNGLGVVYLARHGETAWSLNGQHTGLTDLPLTKRGECDACLLGECLKGLEFGRVFTSPLRRARRTCESAGFGSIAETDPDLVEGSYGDYEALSTAEIVATDFPNGESFEEIGKPADRVVSRIRSVDTCCWGRPA